MSNIDWKIQFLSSPVLGRSSSNHISLTEVGARIILDVAALPLDSLPKIRGVKGMIEETRLALPGMCPNKALDNQKTTNPHMSRYSIGWVSDSRQTPALLPGVSITNLINYISEDSSRVMEGKKHQEN